MHLIEQLRRCHDWLTGEFDKAAEDVSGVSREEMAMEVNGGIVGAESAPRIVCLCGSTRFKAEFIDAKRRETLAGRIVLSVGMFGHHESLDMGGDTKQGLDELHKRKIDLCDEVLILNVGGYVGESTRSEIAYAKRHNKPMRWLEEQAPDA